MDGEGPIEYSIHSSQVQEIVGVEEGIHTIWRRCGYRERVVAGKIYCSRRHSLYNNYLPSPPDCTDIHMLTLDIERGMFFRQIPHSTALLEVRGTRGVIVIYGARSLPERTVMAEDVVRGIAVTHPVLLTRLERKEDRQLLQLGCEWITPCSTHIEWYACRVSLHTIITP